MVKASVESSKIEDDKIYTEVKFQVNWDHFVCIICNKFAPTTNPPSICEEHNQEEIEWYKTLKGEKFEKR